MFGVLRPLLRRFLQPADAAQAVAEVPAGSPAEAAAEAPAKSENRQTKRHQENMQYAQEAAAQGPQMVAMLVKNWMGQKDG